MATTDRRRPGPGSRSATTRQVRAELKESLGLSNIMEVPRLDKIVINMGVGRATQQKSLIEGAMRDLETISGQKPVITKAKKSIAAFKLREGMNIGCKVTLRGQRMYVFLDKLLSILCHAAHPRLPRAFAQVIRQPSWHPNLRGSRSSSCSLRSTSTGSKKRAGWTS